MRRRSFLAAAPAVLLSGCVTVFPKESPVQLYRFGGGLAPVPRPRMSSADFTVRVLPIDFYLPAAGDHILTTTGDEAAFIKGARWISSATELFEQALANAFDADPGPARLMARGEPGRPDLYLKLDVRQFEARYVQGRGGPPSIEVETAASLGPPGARAASAEHLFSASVPADANRGGAIAAAYSQAVTSLLQSLVKWVDARGET